MNEEAPGATGGLFEQANQFPRLSEDDGLSSVHLAIYAFLLARVDDPPNMSEIREHVARLYGAQTQTDRRVRELYPFVEIQKVRFGPPPQPKYQLVGPPTHRRSRDSGSISGRLRAQVLSPGRCAMCGRTPLDDGVKLVVDHKLPQRWGGTDEPENLQPLCDDCNGGKQAWFASLDTYGDEIREASREAETHRRIGELLKAFRGAWVPSDLLGAVASMGAYQEDWQKRLRELRALGWKIEYRRVTQRTGSRRVVTEYRATHFEPWPVGPVRRAITQAERARSVAEDLEVN